MTGDVPGMILSVGRSQVYVPSSKKPLPGIYMCMQAKPKIGFPGGENSGGNIYNQHCSSTGAEDS
jgi:hypothetical protein